MRLLVTGATGFLGQQVVAHALAREHQVLAVVRPGRDVSGVPWAVNAGVTIVEVDLTAKSSINQLAESLVNVDATIHAAGLLSGNDEEHRRGTVEPTRRLVEAMLQANTRRLILISSLSVYGYTALPDGAQLDETSPTEHDLSDRDGYCRAKLAQERILLEAAQLHGLRVTSLRPGAIYGPGRLWSARLGFKAGPLGLLLGGHAAIPLSYVDHCALAVVLAAENDVSASDVYAEPDESGRQGAFEAINVIDDAPPTQENYAALLKKHMNKAPLVILRLPWGVLKISAAGMGLLGMICPGLIARLPQFLRPASLHARAKPLRFSNCRLHDRLGWRLKTEVEQAIAASANSG